jgi:hypothetical protein
LLRQLKINPIAALGWLISKFKLNLDDGFHQWLLEKSGSLKEEIKTSEKTISSDSEFAVRFFDVNLAQCYANSRMVNSYQNRVILINQNLPDSRKKQQRLCCG